MAVEHGMIDPESRSLLAERMRFTGITEGDIALLTDLRPVFERVADRFVDAFYAHLLSSAVLRPFLVDPAVVERLKRAQREYTLSLTSGRYDEAYVGRRMVIGRVHARIGLAPQWYLGTYSLYHDLLVPKVHEHYAADPPKGIRAAAALSKVLILDMQIVLDAYYELRETKAIERSEQLAAVGKMAASIAHEVRNPLAGMRGALQILQRDQSMKSDTHEVMDQLIGQIDRMEGLVRDLLDFASPRPLALRAFDMHELLDRLLGSYEDRAEAAGITFERCYAPETNRIVADPQRMEQVFLNLLENAFQAMDSGGTLTVQIAATARGTIVTLADEGHGIAPDVLPQIFQPFYTTKHRGSGLGLSIVRSIVENHGGTIDVRSELGEGTIVELRLPGAAGR